MPRGSEWRGNCGERGYPVSRVDGWEGGDCACGYAIGGGAEPDGGLVGEVLRAGWVISPQLPILSGDARLACETGCGGCGYDGAGLNSGGKMRRSGLLFGSVFAMSGMIALGQPPAVPQPGIPAVSAANAATPTPMLLWPQGAPGALGDSDDDSPTLAVYLPASNPTKTAVVIAPGGGYQHLSMVKRSEERRVGKECR